jgi:hypothetical protein
MELQFVYKSKNCIRNRNNKMNTYLELDCLIALVLDAPL